MNNTLLKLNIGAGYKKYSGFLNVDADKNCKPDILMDFESDKIPLDDNSVEQIIAHHILEHVGLGFFHLMKEIYRVSRHGAMVDIRVPHHFHETFINDPTHKRPITVEGMRLFSKEYNRLEIERHGSSSTLGLMYDVDFQIVAFDYVYDPFYDRIIKESSNEVLSRLMREAVNTTQETHIVLMVIKDE
jgi:hypothetical protein